MPDSGGRVAERLVSTLAFLRHGTAEAGGYPLPDRERRLTDHGRKEVRQTALGFKRAGYAPVAAYTSPYPRARETAEIFLGAFAGGGSVLALAEDERLVPEAEVDAALSWIEECRLGRGAAKRSHGAAVGAGLQPLLLFVAHEPILSTLASCLVGRRRRALERAELVVLAHQDGDWQERATFLPHA